MAGLDEEKLGEYRLLAELGQGGMADVYLAAIEGPSGSGFTKLAVVKKLRAHLAEDPEFIAMLIDEARITARLTHPNVIQLFELRCVDGAHFLAMEFLDGQPLHRVRQRLAKRAPDLAREVYYAVIAEALAGLHHAHELCDYDGTPLEIVHRDVTPHNVFVTYAGTVKVVDFGIAKAIRRSNQTECGIVKGKIRYMSPEQASGGAVNRRTDIFAAGVMLWNAATGSKLWGELTDFEVSRALRSGEYTSSPQAFRPDVPPEIDAICRRALALRPEDRYATAAEMQSELEAYLGRDIDGARKLGALMHKAFERERAALRGLLESSALTTVAQTHTVVMKFAPAAASPSPVAMPEAEVEVEVEAAAAAPAVPAPKRWRPRAMLAPLAAVVVVAACAMASASRAPTTASSTSTASVTSELTSASTEPVRRRWRRSPPPSLAEQTPRESPARSRSARAGTSTAQSLQAPSPPPSPPSPPPPSPSLSSSSPPKAARARGRGLDQVDPWAE